MEVLVIVKVKISVAWKMAGHNARPHMPLVGLRCDRNEPGIEFVGMNHVSQALPQTDNV
jgi:hypothetical protein